MDQQSTVAIPRVRAARSPGSQLGLGVLIVALLLLAGLIVGVDLTTSASGGRAGSGVATAAPGDRDQRPPRLNRYQSRHYTIFSDLSAEQVRPLGAHMDIVFNEYSTRFANFRARQPGRMPLYVFDRREDYIRHLADFDINATNSAGMFVSGNRTEGLFVWTRDREPSEVLKTLQHEGFHQFAWVYIGPGLPIWANEGIAEYFEDGLLTGNRLTIGLVSGQRVHALRQAIAQQRILRFDEMLGLSYADWSNTLARDPARARVMYNQVWSMVHFLVHASDGRYRDAFERYLGLIAQGRTHQQAFEAAFGTADTAAFEQRWLEYVRDLEPDHIFTAVDRMQFLAMGLRALMDRGEPMPENLEQLRTRLRALGYRAVRVVQGQRLEFDARDDAVFEFEPAAGGTAQFRLLAPTRNHFPPRVAAPGLRPEPTLVWDTNPQTRELEYRITYR
ncbi:MAG: DUF1570 domain-containing protein [Phycisphaeraceae bacterium]|nr:DUF1570 domain-containing protein [Phycisphaeraceae bacterium]